MCMNYDAGATQKFRTDHATFDKFIAYKIMKIVNGNLSSLYYDYIWKPGINESNRTHKFPHITEDEVNRYCTHIYPGIHVYLDIGLALYELQCQQRKCPERVIDGIFEKIIQPPVVVLVRVRCDINDLVGCDAYNKAVFMKVNLTEEEYRKTIEGVA